MKNSQIEALNFKVKSIETFLGVIFKGKTISEKQVFVEKHWEERVLFTDELLRDSY